MAIKGLRLIWTKARIENEAIPLSQAFSLQKNVTTLRQGVALPFVVPGFQPEKE
jgi:hypothetical protein